MGECDQAWSLLTFGRATLLSGYDELVKNRSESPIAPHILSLTVSIYFCLPNISVLSTSLKLQGHHLVHSLTTVYTLTS